MPHVDLLLPTCRRANRANSRQVTPEFVNYQLGPGPRLSHTATSRTLGVTVSELRANYVCLFAILLTMGCAVSGDEMPVGDDDNQDQPGSPDAGSIPDPDPVAVNMYVHTADTLFIVDDVNFALIEVGSFNADSNMIDMAVTPDGEIYAVSFESVFQINQETAAATFRADITYGNVGMTFLPDGTLLAADDAGGVRIIDPVTGAVTEIGAFGNGYALSGDLVAVADGTMYGIADEGPSGTEATNNLLLRVNTSTGAATAIGPIGYAGVYGVAVANDHVYAFTDDGEIIEINPTTGAGTQVASYPDKSFWGAGVTPKARID